MVEENLWRSLCKSQDSSLVSNSFHFRGLFNINSQLFWDGGGREAALAPPGRLRIYTLAVPPHGIDSHTPPFLDFGSQAGTSLQYFSKQPSSLKSSSCHILSPPLKNFSFVCQMGRARPWWSLLHSTFNMILFPFRLFNRFTFSWLHVCLEKSLGGNASTMWEISFYLRQHIHEKWSLIFCPPLIHGLPSTPTNHF